MKYGFNDTSTLLVHSRQQPFKQHLTYNVPVMLDRLQFKHPARWASAREAAMLAPVSARLFHRRTRVPPQCPQHGRFHHRGDDRHLAEEGRRLRERR